MVSATLKTAEEMADTWPVPGSYPCVRWWRMLRNWRESEPPLLKRHIHYDILYREGHAVYAYEERRVLHLVWYTYEREQPHPLCTQLMLHHGATIRALVNNNGNAANAANRAEGSERKRE